MSQHKGGGMRAFNHNRHWFSMKTWWDWGWRKEVFVLRCSHLSLFLSIWKCVRINFSHARIGPFLVTIFSHANTCSNISAHLAHLKALQGLHMGMWAHGEVSTWNCYFCQSIVICFWTHSIWLTNRNFAFCHQIEWKTNFFFKHTIAFQAFLDKRARELFLLRVKTKGKFVKARSLGSRSSLVVVFIHKDCWIMKMLWILFS